MGDVFYGMRHMLTIYNGEGHFRENEQDIYDEVVESKEV
mgnify:CR=1 FL=1